MRNLQKEIIACEHVLPETDLEKEIRRSVDFLENYLEAYPFLKSLMLRISGGQDSTLTGKLCQIATDELRAETGNQEYKFIAIRLPYGAQDDASDAADAVVFQRPNVDLIVNIKNAVGKTVKSLEKAGIKVTDFNKGNIKARQRMIVQYGIARAYSSVVAGTDHAVENTTRFYTKYGDGANDLVPLFRFDRRQGKALFKYLGCPEHLYPKALATDLEEDAPDLPDEVALNVTYKDIDDYLEGKGVRLEAAEKIEAWWNRTKHKRGLPITVFDDFYKK